MKKILHILVGAIFIALIAPIVAQLPSDAINGNREAVGQPSTTTIINPMDPNYIWGNPLAVDLNGVNPAVFQNMAFSKDPGGILGSSLYTTSINDFRKADPNAGYSNVPMKVAKVGLVSKAINTSVNASQNSTQ